VYLLPPEKSSLVISGLRDEDGHGRGIIIDLRCLEICTLLSLRATASEATSAPERNLLGGNARLVSCTTCSAFLFPFYILCLSSDLCSGLVQRNTTQGFLCSRDMKSILASAWYPASPVTDSTVPPSRSHGFLDSPDRVLAAGIIQRSYCPQLSKLLPPSSPSQSSSRPQATPICLGGGFNDRW
jgi:hypothetical protein